MRRNLSPDVAVAATLAVLAVAEVVLRGHGVAWITLSLIATVPHAVRGGHPWAAVGATLAGAAGFAAVGVMPFELPYVVLASGLLSFHTILRRLDRLPAWLLCGMAVAGVVLLDGTLGGSRREVTLYALGLVIAGAVADLRRSRTEIRQVREDSLRQIIGAQREQAAMAERARIAREMHDIVAHSISTIAVQAETAPYTLGGLDERVAGEFADVAGTARRTLAEMRSLLGVLRSDGPAATAPQPGLALLPELVARHAGEVELVTVGEPRPLPQAVDLSAYRIVQESLTNVRRHAPAARAHVELTYGPALLTIRVEDDGPGPSGGEPGHGLVGMRERALALNGWLTAEPGPLGGFLVTAGLPTSGASR